MSLSEYERRVLEQMEQHLASDDPVLLSTLRSRARRDASRRVLVAIGFVAGLVLLVTGVATVQLWLGVTGFLLMFAAAVVGLAEPRGAPRARRFHTGRRGPHPS